MKSSSKSIPQLRQNGVWFQILPYTVFPEIFMQALFSLNFVVWVGPQRLNAQIFTCEDLESQDCLVVDWLNNVVSPSLGIR